MSVKLYFDGASKGNNIKSEDSIAGCGYCIKYDDISKTPYGGYKFLGNATNNEAEYKGLIYGLQLLLKAVDSIDELKVYGDSKLVIEQMKGSWKVNAHNLVPLWQEAQMLTKKFKKVEFCHILRNLNSEADRMANLSIMCKGDSESGGESVIKS